MNGTVRPLLQSDDTWKPANSIRIAADLQDGSPCNTPPPTNIRDQYIIPHNLSSLNSTDLGDNYSSLTRPTRRFDHDADAGGHRSLAA
mmetsp:Transcript_48762/g.101811  ORF Transcript_48762/g.101811 Transcript_48762/m.101811 type:complete len:88 (+) Transcript_48762:338-601(+)